MKLLRSITTTLALMALCAVSFPVGAQDRLPKKQTNEIADTQQGVAAARRNKPARRKPPSSRSVIPPVTRAEQSRVPLW